LDRRALPLALLLAVAAGLSARPLGRGPLRLELGGFDAGLTSGGWGRSDRLDLDAQATSDGLTSFYYRPSPANAALHLPVVSRGPALLTLRASASVRSGVSVFVDGARAGELLVQPRLWSRYALLLPPATGALDVLLALRPLPLVKGGHADDPRLLIDFVELQSEAGLASSWRACLRVALVPLLVFGFGVAVGCSPRGSLLGALAAATLATLAARAAPFPTFLAIPRLLPLALLAGLLAHLLLRRARALRDAERSLLAALVAAGALAHGCLVFFPDHNPPDIDIHVRRTLDLGGVPLDYQALLRYGSQLPTASQDQGAATAALGERTLIPYSPLPYFLYYAFHLLGMDLYWGMTALNAALAMLVAPLLFAAARVVWDAGAAWLATLLYTLDLAVWHHVGRSHAPAVAGNALAVSALLLLAARAGSLGAPARAAWMGAALGVAALGYSSNVVLFGLLGLLLLALLALDAAGLTAAARRGVALSLVMGGLIAGALFYFHYLPGLLRGARGVEAEPDLFPGRTFFIFHNESRISMRLWMLGLAWPFAAGLLAAPVALQRAAPSARPVLLAWLGAWGLIMLLKEPLFFPKLLRWAKEDQFLSPLLCLTMAAACQAIRPRPLRVLVSLLLLLAALLLQLRDFRHHATSLLL
jgi:hypothetical protein